MNSYNQKTWPSVSSSAEAVRPVAVIDIGSNSIRLVVYDGAKRAPIPIFNERVLCGLGRGLDNSGKLNQEGLKLALESIRRFVLITKTMDVTDVNAFATAAVREASNGRALVEKIKYDCGLDVEIISGENEAKLAALGVISEVPNARGIMGDMGGASLELALLENGHSSKHQSVPIGPLRSTNIKNKEVYQDYLSKIDWLDSACGQTFYAVGGVWRTWARAHMANNQYPLSIVHHYELTAQRTLSFIKTIESAASKQDDNFFSKIPANRRDSLPYANKILKHLILETGVSCIIFSAYGVREGVIYNRLPQSLKNQDPLIAACKNLAGMTGRPISNGDLLYNWTKAAFPNETPSQSRLRQAACLLADLEWSEHVDYRAEHALLRILRYPLIGIDHPSRAFVGLAVASRHAKVKKSLLDRYLKDFIDPSEVSRAQATGLAIRLAYTLSGGITSLLKRATLQKNGDLIELLIDKDCDFLVGDVVKKRFSTLADSLSCRSQIIST